MSMQSGTESGSLDHDHFDELDDPRLDAAIKSFRKAEFELQEILSDPCLDQTRQEVASMIVSNKENNKERSSGEAERFIKSSMPGYSKSKTRQEQDEVKKEISKSEIDDLSAEWVREWHIKKQMQAFSSTADEERKKFITAALSEEQGKFEDTPVVAVKQISQKSKILRFSSFAAAAMLGLFLVVRALTPSGNPEKVFNTYYSTFTAVSPTVRGGDNNINDIYISALNSYKAGDYSAAEAGFTKAFAADPSFGDPLFYLGLSQIETGKTDEAINSFNEVIMGSGSTKKEAIWYLGFAYLKKGDKDGARDCFSKLAGSDGYYREAAEKVLRRLK